jgi:hypothetical protein
MRLAKVLTNRGHIPKIQLVETQIEIIIQMLTKFKALTYKLV